MLKKQILMIGILLTGLIFSFSSMQEAYAEPAAVDTSIFQTANLLRTSASHADLMYQPLFAARPEDREKLAKVSLIMSTVWSKGRTAVKKELDPFESFFDTDMLVELTNGQSVVLYPEDAKSVGMAYGEAYKILENQEIHDLLQSLFVTGARMTISPEKMKIGEKVQVKGSDGMGERGPVYVFWEPASGGSSTSLESADGLIYPSRASLLIYQDEYRFGRYNFEFTLPAYGKAIDGTMKPIPSGGANMVVDLGSMFIKQITISSERPASISLDGTVLTEPDAQPVIRNNITYLPVRAVAELIGQELQWDGASKSVLIRTNSAAAVKRADGQIGLWMDGKQSAVQPLNMKNTVYIPLRVAAEAFGLQINWNAATRTVEIRTGGEEE